MREKMNSILHIFRKDFRHLRLLLGVWFLLTTDFHFLTRPNFAMLG